MIILARRKAKFFSKAGLIAPKKVTGLVVLTIKFI